MSMFYNLTWRLISFTTFNMKSCIMTSKLGILLLLCSSTCFYTANAQQDSAVLTFSCYLETYYAYDFAQPDQHDRPGFLYSFNRHNEVNLNLGFLKAAYSTSKVRGNLALMSGTYAKANLAAEPAILQHILEANAGVKISKKANLWVDAGIFASHIGFESAIGKDCWNLTRGILAENSPYYESGVKIGYTSGDGRWFLSALMLNGWQRIQRPDGNNTPAFGHQITFRPNDKITLNSSSFIGNDKPDTVSQMRYFHNFYGIFQLSEQIGLTLGFDIGAEQKAHESSDYHLWYTPVAVVKYAANDRLSIAVRGELYADPDGVIIATGTLNGFQTSSFSANVDYAFRQNVLWRVEARHFNSRDKIFLDGQRLSNTNTFVATALAISF